MMGDGKKVADKLCDEYKLHDNSSFLRLGCEKGFLLKDLRSKYANMKITGLETSNYAISNSMNEIKMMLNFVIII